MKNVRKVSVTGMLASVAMLAFILNWASHAQPQLTANQAAAFQLVQPGVEIQGTFWVFDASGELGPPLPMNP